MTLSFPINGTIRQVNVQRGDAVSAGDLLADYDVSSLENPLANARIQLESALASVDTTATGGIEGVENAEITLANARISLESTRCNSPWTSVASARLQVDSAEQALANAERSYRDALSHPENSASLVDNAYQQVLSAQNQLASAQNGYFSAAQSFNNHQYQVQPAENQVLQAEITLQRAIDAAAKSVTKTCARPNSALTSCGRTLQPRRFMRRLTG
jgi:multidrug efflux pump subunit AcrA (membrane-fusion protein)